MELLDLGLKSYEETWELQKQLLEKRARGETVDTLILVEHPAVYTMGRAGAAEEGGLARGPAGAAEAGATAEPKSILVRKLGAVPVIEVERGGRLTFHGPGQLVGYPIFGLPHHDLRRYLRDVERALMTVINEQTMLPARPCPESLLLEAGQLQTGVWVRDHKLASIGIAVRKWVTYHGFALNLSTDLRYFEAVSPCGFHGAIMTNLVTEMGADANIPALTANIKRGLAEKFREISDEYRLGASVSQPVLRSLS